MRTENNISINHHVSHTLITRHLLMSQNKMATVVWGGIAIVSICKKNEQYNLFVVGIKWKFAISIVLVRPSLLSPSWPSFYLQHHIMMDFINADITHYAQYEHLTIDQNHHEVCWYVSHHFQM